MPSSQPPTMQQHLQHLHSPTPRFHLRTFQITIEAPTTWPDERSARVHEALEDLWKRYVESFNNNVFLIDEHLTTKDLTFYKPVETDETNSDGDENAI